MKPSQLWTLTHACLPFLVSSAPAATLDDIEFWVGTGENRAALVVDWNDGKPSESLIWGYQWDGTATGLDMLQAVVEADPRFYAHVSAPGAFGVSVFGLGYDLNANGSFAVSPTLAFNNTGWAVGTPDDTRTSLDPQDHWVEGWNLGFWGYNLKESSSAPWNSALSSPGDRLLNNGGWDGFSFAPDFNFTDPSEAFPAPVPEPSTWALVILGAFTLIQTRSRRSRP